MHTVGPRQVLLGGCFLAFGAAFVNVGFVIEVGASVSHLTGDLTRLAIDLTSGDAEYARHLFHVGLATLSFVVGALLSGYFLHLTELEVKKPYGRVVTGIGATLVLAYLLVGRSVESAIALSGAACGLQNALATRYRGSVLRTTHVTGLLTDLGVMLGMRFRGRNIESWRIGVPFFLSLSFFLGALSGAVCTAYLGEEWLLFGGIGYVLGGIGWSLVKRLYFRV